MPDRSTTPRGFTVYDQLTDTYGATVRVQQSSAAMHGARVWIFAEHPKEMLTTEDLALFAAAGIDIREVRADIAASPHLDVEQAKRVRDALDVFIRENEGENRG